MDSYIYIITALLPLAALMLVFQTNPYHALVIRGILGALAALVYAMLGAADVALTEALVGTLLAITLYAVAVRSSMVVRLGVLSENNIQPVDQSSSSPQIVFQQLLADLKKVFSKRYLRIELIHYGSHEHLHQALIEQEVHAICIELRKTSTDLTHDCLDASKPYHIKTRLRHLYEILKLDLTDSSIVLFTNDSPACSTSVNASVLESPR